VWRGARLRGQRDHCAPRGNPRLVGAAEPQRAQAIRTRPIMAHHDLWLSICFCEKPVSPVRPVQEQACEPRSDCVFGKLQDSYRFKVSLTAAGPRPSLRAVLQRLRGVLPAAGAHPPCAGRGNLDEAPGRQRRAPPHRAVRIHAHRGHQLDARRHLRGRGSRRLVRRKYSGHEQDGGLVSRPRTRCAPTRCGVVSPTSG